jgi:hypothetical protein
MAPRNMQGGRGQCERRAVLWAGKICRSGQLLPGSQDGIGHGKAWFYWVFLHGTALAENADTNELSAAPRGLVGVPPCSLLWALRHRPSMLSRR